MEHSKRISSEEAFWQKQATKVRQQTEWALQQLIEQVQLLAANEAEPVETREAAKRAATILAPAHALVVEIVAQLATGASTSQALLSATREGELA